MLLAQNEKLIVTKLVETLIAQGFFIVINDGESNITRPSKDLDWIVESALDTGTDECILKAYTKSEVPKKLIFEGSVTLISNNGNDGLDIISDNSMSLQIVLEPVMEFINQLELEQ